MEAIEAHIRHTRTLLEYGLSVSGVDLPPDAANRVELMRDAWDRETARETVRNLVLPEQQHDLKATILETLASQISEVEDRIYRIDLREPRSRAKAVKVVKGRRPKCR